MNNIRRVGAIGAIAGAVVVGVIVLALSSVPSSKKDATSISGTPSLPPKTSQSTFPTSTSYAPYYNTSLANRTSTAVNGHIGLQIEPCLELSTENGLQINGTAQSPIDVHRGNGGITLPICFRSDDPVGTSYSLAVTRFPGNPNAGYHLEAPQSYGLQASLNKDTLTVPPQTASILSSHLTVFDRAILSLSASGNATLGAHVIGIQASKLGAVGQTPEIVHSVYLRIQ